MNKKEMILTTVICLVCFISVKSFAAFELAKVNLDLVNNHSSVTLRSGSFVTNNVVATNGDTLEETNFIPDGGSISPQATGSQAIRLVYQLIADNAVNITQFAQDTTGQSNVYIPGDDSSVVDVPATNGISNGT